MGKYSIEMGSDSHADSIQIHVYCGVPPTIGWREDMSGGLTSTLNPHVG